MEQFHEELSEKHSWYKNWHENGSYKLIHLVVLGVVAAVVIFVLAKTIQNEPTDTNNGNNGTTQTPGTTEGGASLTLNPANKAVKVGETFNMEINLNTGGGSVDAIDIFSLHFDPKVIQVVDASTSQSGIQIQGGSLFALPGPNMADNAAGTVKFGQASTGGTSYKGSGVVATVQFKAVGAGDSRVYMDFTAGSTVDTNTAFQGKDQLKSVTEASISVLSN